MSAAKEFRERYGVSQPDLAVYLSVSLSLLKQSEIHARSLSTEALLKLGAVTLYEVKEATENKPSETETETTHPQNKKLDRASRKASLQLYVAQQQLEKTQKRYGQAQRLLALCNHLLAQNPTDEIDKLWLQTQQFAAKKRLKEYGKDEQTLLQWKIACLEFAISKSNELMTTNNEISYTITTIQSPCYSSFLGK